MKNLRYLLFAFLLLVGIGKASAQVYYLADEEFYQDEVEFTDGMLVGIHSAANNAYYLNGSKQTNEAFGNDNVYVLEAAGNLEEDGKTYPLWRIKQMTTGQYIKHSEIEEYAPGGAQAEYLLTDTVEQAMTFTIQMFCEEGDENYGPRTAANDKKQDLDDYGYVICSSFVYSEPWEKADGTESDSVIHTYLGSVGAPMLSTWIDTNVWWFFPAAAAEGQDLVKAAMADLGAVDPSAYVVGTNPGQVSQKALDDYTTARQALADLAASGSTDNAAIQKAVEDLKAAKDALEASIVKIEVGDYYMLQNMRNGNYLHIIDGALKFAAPANPDVISVEDASYYFQVVKADSLFGLKNFETGTYVSDKFSDNYIHPGAVPADLEFTVQTGGSSQGVFNIKHISEEAPHGGWWHYQAAGDQLVTWNSPTGDANLFKFVTIPAESIAGITEAVEQEKRNAAMEEVLGKARNLYGGSRNYIPSADCTLDGNLDAMGLVTSANQLSTNCQETSEGPLPDVLDNNVATFFHSKWQGGGVADPWVAANLVSDVDGISLKLARRTNAEGTAPHGNQGPAPASFVVYGSNDSINWVNEGVAKVDWAYDYTKLPHDTILAQYPDSVLTFKNFVGVAAAQFSAPYKYVRISCPAANTTNGTSAWWYISELRYFAGATYDAATSPYEQAPEASRTEFEAAIAAAEAELAAGKATTATTERLQAIYDVIIKEIPSTAYLHDLIDNSRTLINNAEEGAVIGMYAEGSKAAFLAVLDEVEPTIEETWTVEQIAAAEATVEAALAEFNAAFQIPVEGKFYAIRSMSRKLDQGGTLNKVGNMLTARNIGQQCYVYGNNNGEIGSEFSEANDTINVTELYNSLWIFEYPVEGCTDTIYLRNAGTGLYMGEGANLAAEPFKIGFAKFTVSNDNVWGKCNFVFDLNGTNLNVAHNLNVLTWKDANDVNAAFRIEEVEGTGITTQPITAGIQAVCLPYTIENYVFGGMCYEVVGKNGEQMILQEFSGDVIPAATPFIYVPEEDNVTEVTYALYDLDGNPIGSAVPEFDLEGKEVNGLVGTVIGATIPEGYGRISNGKVVATKSKETTISANSGYFNGKTAETTEAGELALEISGTVDSIEDLIIIPAKESMDVYTIDGILVRSNVKGAAAVQGLPAGIYVVGGQKVIIK